MPDQQARILIDESFVLVDGHPFFTFGPRVLLTAPDRYRPLLLEFAAAGFTAVGTPPCSPGNLECVDAFFDAAEEAGLLVVLIADPRLPEHGRVLADRFGSRPNLHSYLLPPRENSPEALREAVRERDSLRAGDVFHPIWFPLCLEQMLPEWLAVSDLCGPSGEALSERSTRPLPPDYRPLLSAATTTMERSPDRPIILPDIPVLASNHERRMGLYSDDPWVARLSSRSIDWYPFLANFYRIPRRDVLGPEPERLRLQLYTALQAGGRGALLDFAEGLGGPLPYTGRDRFCEAAIIAQEIALGDRFFSGGMLEKIPIDSGHPRLSIACNRERNDRFLVLRLEGYEGEFFIDEAFLERVEIEIPPNTMSDCQFWRVDFPAVTQLPIHREATGAIRVNAGAVELTGLIVATNRPQLAVELSAALKERLPHVARFAIEIAQVRFGKIQLVEGELGHLSVGINNRERLRAVATQIESAQRAYQQGNFEEAFRKARECQRMLRIIVKYQMAKALSMPLISRDTSRNRYRMNYFTLPRFYREGAIESSQAFLDVT